MKNRGVAVLLTFWMATSGALLLSSMAFGGGRTEVEQIVTRPYERLTEVIREVERAARDFLDAGGAARPGGVDAAYGIGRGFVERRLSPGGAADTLAAACLVMRIGSLGVV